MSNLATSKDDIALAIKVANELSSKEMEIRKATVDLKYEKLTKQKQELESFKNFSIGWNDEKLKTLKAQNREYIDLAKTGCTFLNIAEFTGMVPVFPRNLVLVGAETGAGKSTLTANMTMQFLRQSKRVLTITNEEHPTDILNRVICLFKGWSYHDHASITPEQQDVFDEMYPKITERLDIVDDNYNGVGGLTTTIEGLESILTSLKANPKKYDIIIIDYFQNINSSHKNPGASGFEVLHNVGRALDLFKNVYNAPIILLSQLKAAGSEDDSKPFEERIPGRKSIMTFATCAIEAKADKENSCTEWIFRKSRFAKSMGKKIKTGFDRGLYVPHTVEFKRKMEEERVARQMQFNRNKDIEKLQKTMGLKEKEYEKV